MAELSELQMNVAALKRVDPYVKEILGTATHVALYTFNADASEWERTDVEGALFVYSRNGEPYHGILIMNRLNTKNLVEPVVQGLELQLQEPFLLYRNTNCRIFGIWFYDKEQCTRIASMLDKLVKDLDTLKKIPDKIVVRNKTTGSGTAGVDIFSMLNKAQEDYNSNKIPGQNKSSVAKPATETNKLIMHDNVPPKSVIDFFAKASVPQFAVHKSPHASGLIVTHPQRTGLVRDVADDSHLKPILQRLMSNPAHSVEHIEKQQRSATPHNDTPNNEEKHVKKEIKVLNGNVLKGHTVSNSLGEKAVGLVPVEMENPKSFSESNATTIVENSMKFLRIASPNPTGPGIAPFFGPVVQPMTNNGISINPVSDQRSSSAPAYNNETPSKLALMPPTMFTSSISKESTNLDVSNGSSAVTEHQTSFGSCNASTTSTAATTTTATTTVEDTAIQIKPEPLTKNQLLQAFNYLIKNDTDFMTKLHEAYVKSFSDIVKS